MSENNPLSNPEDNSCVFDSNEELHPSAADSPPSDRSTSCNTSDRSSGDNPASNMNALLEGVNFEIDSIPDYSGPADCPIFNSSVDPSITGPANSNKYTKYPLGEDGTKICASGNRTTGPGSHYPYNIDIEDLTNDITNTCPFRVICNKSNEYCNKDGVCVNSCPVKYMHKRITQILSIEEKKRSEENLVNNHKSNDLSTCTAPAVIEPKENNEIDNVNTNRKENAISPIPPSPISNEYFDESDENPEDDIVLSGPSGYSVLHKPMETPSCPFSSNKQKFLSVPGTDLSCLVTGKQVKSYSASAKDDLQAEQEPIMANNEDHTTITPTIEEKMNLFTRYMETEKAGAAMTGILNRVTLKTLQRDKKSLQRLALFGSGGGGPLLRKPLINMRSIVPVNKDPVSETEVTKTDADTLYDDRTDIDRPNSLMKDGCNVRSKRYNFSSGDSLSSKDENNNELECRDNAEEISKNHNPLHNDEEQDEDYDNALKDNNNYPRNQEIGGIHGMNIIDVRASLTTTAPSLLLDDESSKYAQIDKTSEESETFSQRDSVTCSFSGEKTSLPFRPFASLSKQMATAMAMRFVCQVTSPCERRHSDLYMRLFAEACGIKNTEFVPSLQAYVGWDPVQKGAVDLSTYASSSSIPPSKSAVSLGVTSQLDHPPRTFLHDVLAPLYAPRTKHFFEKWSDAAAEYQKEECNIIEKKKNGKFTEKDEIKLKEAANQIEKTNDSLVHCLRILSKLLHYHAISCETVGDVLNMLIQESNDFLILQTCVNFRSLSLSPTKPKYRDFCVYPYAHRYIALFIGFCLKESSWFRRFINQTGYETGGQIRESVIRELHSAKRLLEACAYGGNQNIQAWANPKGFMALMDITLENIKLSGVMVAATHSGVTTSVTTTQAAPVQWKNVIGEIKPNTPQPNNQTVGQQQYPRKKITKPNVVMERPPHINSMHRPHNPTHSNYHNTEFIGNGMIPLQQTNIKTHHHYAHHHPVTGGSYSQQPFCDPSLSIIPDIRNTIPSTSYPTNKGNYVPSPFNPSNVPPNLMLSSAHIPSFIVPMDQRQAMEPISFNPGNHLMNNYHPPSAQFVVNQQLTSIQHQNYHMSPLQEITSSTGNHMSLQQQAPYFSIQNDITQQGPSVMSQHPKHHDTQALVSKLTEEEKNQLLITLLQDHRPHQTHIVHHQPPVATHLSHNPTNMWQPQMNLTHTNINHFMPTDTSVTDIQQNTSMMGIHTHNGLVGTWNSTQL